jgi:hypothetical protein
VAASEADRVTVRQLLGLSVLQEATLLAGGAGLERVVEKVRLAPEGRLVAGDFDGALVVMDGTQLSDDTYVVDFTLRWMEDHGARGLMVVNPAREVGIASRRLAEKLALPLVVTPASVLELADALRDVVEAPTRVLARMVIDATERLAKVSAQQGVAGCLRAVEESLTATATLLGAEGGTVAGPDLEPPLSSHDRLPVVTSTRDGHLVRVIQPITLAGGEQPSFWVVVGAEAPTPAWERAAGVVAKISASFIATRLVTTRLERERDARFRLGVLNAIIAVTDRPEASLVHEIATLGWQTDGWCSAIHFRVGGSPAAARVLALTDEFGRLLGEAGLAGPLIERPHGWTTWLISVAEPPAGSYAQVVASVRSALRQFGEGRSLRLYAGVGRPYHGLAGLRKSLAEAREAATIAQAGGARIGVQHIDELGVRRILFGWYTSDEFGEVARTLLAPVQAINKDDDLLRTLEVYLDNESSPTVAAAILGLHRNTVINRIARIREVLAVDLDDPDQRLAVQLACRLVNLRA